MLSANISAWPKKPWRLPMRLHGGLAWPPTLPLPLHCTGLGEHAEDLLPFFPVLCELSALL